MYPRKQQGYIMILGIVVMAVLVTMSAAVWGYTTLQVKAGRQAVTAVQIQHLAEAGIDSALNQLNLNPNFSGEANIVFGPGVYTSSVTSINAGTKQISVTAYIPDQNNPVMTRTIKARTSINSSLISFRYGVQIGNGGAIMGNGAQINGNLFSNGSVVGGGSNGAATVTGDLIVAGGTQATADQSWTNQNSSFNVADVSAHAGVAQSFKPSSSNVLNKVSLYIKKVGTPSDIAIKIVADNGGKPNNSALATGSISSSSVAGLYGFVDATLNTNPSLTAGQTYWIIAVASVNASNYYMWGMDNTDSYTNGTGKYSSNWSANNASWTATGGDLDFQAYMGGVVTTMNGVIVGGNTRAHSLSNCQVTKDAYYQTINSCTVGGTSHPGSTDVSPAAMPVSDGQVDEWEATAEAGSVINGDYTVNGTVLLGPVKINGNLAVNGTLYLTGPIWVNGNISFRVNSGLIVHSSTNNNGAVIIADAVGQETTKGIIDMSNNMTIAGNGNEGSYPMVLSTKVGDNAITMGNNAQGVILYASYGTVNITNNAQVNQITANTLNMANNTTVNYVAGLQSQSFSNGPGGSWTIVPGTYVISEWKN